MTETGEFSHLDASGKAQMVDVSKKIPTLREAKASCLVHVGPRVMGALKDKAVPKGDVFAAARIAGILAAKKVDEIIPLCHPLPLDFVSVDFELEERENTVKVIALARTTGQTGVEMEAMTAASVAALTIYDMVKALEKGVVITALQLEYKSGGKSGTWKRAQSGFGGSNGSKATGPLQKDS